MSIASVKEVLGGQGAAENDGIITADRSFLVTLTAASASGPLEAMYATDGVTTIPAYGAQYPLGVTNKARARVVSKTVSPHAADTTRLVYVVTVSYSNKPEALELITSSNPDVAPWNRDPVYDYDFDNADVELDMDKASTPIRVCNAAGDKLDPPVVVSEARPRIVISRAKTSYDLSTAISLINTVNAATVAVNGVNFSAGTLRLLKWSGRENTYTDSAGSDTTYYEQVIELEYGAAGFDIVRVNEGLKEKTAGGSLLPILCADGSNTSTPRLLNANGTAASIGATPNYLTFVPYAKSSWTALDLS